MFGPRLGTVFASRWKALWWSAAVMLTAYCSVPSAEESKPADAAEAKAVQQAVAALGKLNQPANEE